MARYHARCTIADGDDVHFIRVDAESMRAAVEALQLAGTDVRSISVEGRRSLIDAWRASPFKSVCGILFVVLMLASSCLFIAKGRFPRLVGVSPQGIAFGYAAFLFVAWTIVGLWAWRVGARSDRSLRVGGGTIDIDAIRASGSVLPGQRSLLMRACMVCALPGFLIMATVSLLTLLKADPVEIDATFMLVIAGYMLGSYAFAPYLPDPLSNGKAMPVAARSAGSSG